MRLAKIRGRLPIICAAAFLCLAIGVPAVAAAKQKKITGTLSQGGYTVIALAEDGEAKTDRAPNGEFKLRPPAKKVTLHLRAADGTYAGPIVVGTKKQRQAGDRGRLCRGQARQGQGQVRQGLRQGQAPQEVGRHKARGPGQEGRPDRRRQLRPCEVEEDRGRCPRRSRPRRRRQPARHRRRRRPGPRQPRPQAATREARHVPPRRRRRIPQGWRRATSPSRPFTTAKSIAL